MSDYQINGEYCDIQEYAARQASVRQAFTETIQRQAADPEKVARLELAREYFTDPLFATHLTNAVYTLLLSVLIGDEQKRTSKRTN